LVDVPATVCFDQKGTHPALLWLHTITPPGPSIPSKAPPGCATGLFYALLDVLRTGSVAPAMDLTNPLPALGLTSLAPMLIYTPERLSQLPSSGG
jgi:hypothetical protein